MTTATTNGTPPAALRDLLLRRRPVPTAGTFQLDGDPPLTVHLRRWSVRDTFTVEGVSAAKDRPGSERLAELVRLAACDEAGCPVFESAEQVYDVLTVAECERLVTAALDANGLGKGAAERGKGNSPPTTS